MTTAHALVIALHGAWRLFEVSKRLREACRSLPWLTAK